MRNIIAFVFLLCVLPGMAHSDEDPQKERVHIQYMLSNGSTLAATAGEQSSTITFAISDDQTEVYTIYMYRNGVIYTSFTIDSLAEVSIDLSAARMGIYDIYADDEGTLVYLGSLQKNYGGIFTP